MNENQLTIVKEYKFDNPLIQNIDIKTDNSITGCHNKYFHTFDHICEYNIIFTNFGNNETFNLPISDKSMGLYELNKKVTIAQGNGFKFNQINKLTKKNYSNLTNINIHYYIKLRIPMCHRLFFRRISQNRDYIQAFCSDRRNSFHFACPQRFSYNNPQCDMV